MQSRILEQLKSSQSHISGEDISRRLNISRAAVWKHIKQLREKGYSIVAAPHLGYRLESVPDKLLAQEIKNGLLAEDFGVHIFAHEEIDSTMNHAVRLGLQGAEEGTLVITESQTQGRGRQGRSWVSPSGVGVYLSIVLRPRLSAMEVPKLTLMTAVALSEAIEKVSGVSAQIKWPNDLLVNGKKLAGILTEMNGEMDCVNFVVIGVGLNINNSEKNLIKEATSIQMESGNMVSRIEVVQVFLNHWEQVYKQVLGNGFNDVVLRWKKRSVTLGRQVKIQDGKKFIEGKAIDLAEDGGLLIELVNGDVIKKMSGDVTTSSK